MKRLPILAMVLIAVGGLCWLIVSGQSSPEKNSDFSGAASAESDAQLQNSRDPGDFELAKDKQKSVWNAEHITFEIEFKLGRRIKQAIRSQNMDAFGSVLCEDFSGKVFESPNVRSRSHAGIEETFQDAAADELRSTDAAEFTESWGKRFSRIAAFDDVSLRVLKIRKLDDQTWETKLLLSVFGRNDEERIIELVSTNHVVMRFAGEEMLETSPVIQEWTGESLRVLTRPGLLFEEITEASGLDRIPVADNWKIPTRDASQYRFQMAVADFDRDGWLDLALAEKHTALLLRWDPETEKFLNVTKEKGILGRHTPLRKPADIRNARFLPNDLAGWIDFDNDGFPDLLLGNRLYHNERGRRFRDVTLKSGLRFQMQSMGVLVADYDADGLLDLYIIQQSSSEGNLGKSNLSWVNEDEHGEPNRLWRNLGGGRFQDVTGESGAGGGRCHTLAAAWFFYDDDHYPDLYIANDFNKNVLLRNRGDGTFEDISEASGTSDFATSMGVAAGDTDNNGTSDLYVANMYSKMGRRVIAHVCEEDYPPGIYKQIQGSCAGNRLYRRLPGESRYTEHGSRLEIDGVGWAYAPAMADFDNDGWLDLYATTGFLSFERNKPDG